MKDVKTKNVKEKFESFTRKIGIGIIFKKFAARESKILLQESLISSFLYFQHLLNAYNIYQRQQKCKQEFHSKFEKQIARQDIKVEYAAPRKKEH